MRTVGNPRDKIVALEDLAGIAAKARASGDRIVFSHGIFDLLHPGHFDHLQQARSLGELLVVSTTSDRHVRRGPGRPVFPEELRIRSLAALECVDIVVLSDYPSAIPIIDALSPDVYVKGREYSESRHDPSTGFSAESTRVEELGGQIRFIGGMIYSSTRLLNDHFAILPTEASTYAMDFRTRWDRAAIREAVESLRALRVLVVGEVIIDEYITCEVLGVTPKERVPSLRSLASRRDWGGSYAIASHLANCCGSVTLLSLAAPTDVLAEMDRRAVDLAPPNTADPAPVRLELVLDELAATVTKQRYVVENTLREELSKIFAVGHLPILSSVSDESRGQFREKIRVLAERVDLVVVADFGHGVFDQETMDDVQDSAPLLALNCQSNSANWGFNPITKYRRADFFCLDEGELSLAFRDRSSDQALLLARLCESFGSRQGWLTLGAGGALGCDDTGVAHPVPALTLQVRDTLGAGDAFFSWASASGAAGLPLEMGSFLGSVAAALAANIVGNERPVGRVDVLRLVSTLIDS